MSSKYDNLKVDELKSMLRKKGLKVSGRKADLIERLQTKVNKGTSYVKKEYRTLPKSVFCGPAGGSSPRSYPVNTEARCRSALSYARYAPNPEGIRQCALQKAREHPNWRCGVKYGLASPRHMSPRRK
jgi:hypothetical protein